VSKPTFIFVEAQRNKVVPVIHLDAPNPGSLHHLMTHRVIVCCETSSAQPRLGERRLWGASKGGLVHEDRIWLFFCPA
jgi:hypothetical protein